MTRDEAVNLIEAHEHVVRRWAGAHHDKIEDAIAEQVASREPLIAALTAPAAGEDEMKVIGAFKAAVIYRREGHHLSCEDVRKAVGSYMHAGALAWNQFRDAVLKGRG